MTLLTKSVDGHLKKPWERLENPKRDLFKRVPSVLLQYEREVSFTVLPIKTVNYHTTRIFHELFTENKLFNT